MITVHCTFHFYILTVKIYTVYLHKPETATDFHDMYTTINYISNCIPEITLKY